MTTSNNNRAQVQSSQSLKDRSIWHNDENSRFGAGGPRVYRNAKSREVLGELPATVEFGGKLNVLSDNTTTANSQALTHQQRKRPLRNAKLGSVAGNDENSHNHQKYKTTDYDHVPRKSGFSVHVDSDDNSNSSHVEEKFNMSLSKEDLAVESRLDLHAAVTALPKQAFGRARETYDNSIESPMVLDTTLSSVNKSDIEEVVCPVSQFDAYKDDIFKYIRQSEEKYHPKPHYMRKQTDITYSMRSILVDWLVEVAEEYKLLRQTLFLAVNYIDRFLSTMAVNRGKLQLLGTACMFIASKYEEIEAPDLGEFVYITDDTYTRNQVLKMEQMILKVLSFTVAVPTANTFLEHYLYEANFDNKQLEYLSMFLLELTMLDADPYLQFTPSVIAASAFFLSAKILELESPWPTELEQLSGYAIADFLSCVQLLYGTHKNASRHQQQSIYQKYNMDKFLNVAATAPLQIKNLRFP